MSENYSFTYTTNFVGDASHFSNFYIQFTSLEDDSTIIREPLNINDQEARKITVGQQGYLFVSILGDKKRLDRREHARTQIESRQCPMPHLSAVLEGKSVSSSLNTKREYPALSDTVKKEIFTKKCLTIEMRQWALLI